MTGDANEQPVTELDLSEQNPDASEAERAPIGYGRPPKEGQFKPGISGNPKGKPRGRRSLGAALEAFLSEKVTVTEHGEKRKIAKRDVIAKQLVNKAAGGDLAAIRFVTHILEGLATAKMANAGEAPTRDQLSEADQAVIAALIERFGGPTP